MKLSLGHWKCMGSVIIYGESFLLPIIYFSEITKLDHKHGYLKNQSTKIPFSEDVVLLIYVRSKTGTAKVKLRGVIYKIHKTKCASPNTWKVVIFWNINKLGKKPSNSHLFFGSFHLWFNPIPTYDNHRSKTAGVLV